MVDIKGMWKDLRATPVETLVRWQEQRFLWLLMAVAMGGLIILAHSFFQIYLYMAPCEQCVYIRFAMFVMVFGGLIAAINPKNIILKLIGCLAAFYGSIMGIKFSVKLNGIHYAVHNPDPDALFGVQGCSTDPTFPFGLPLAEWAPEWFRPTGDCGYDAPVVLTRNAQFCPAVVCGNVSALRRLVSDPALAFYEYGAGVPAGVWAMFCTVADYERRLGNQAD
uniref:Protein-disulfide oxidoreductase DsbI n=1 Tax=Lelliottia amnigena TaxID=61646 RepID=DSBI_LELAM|nr:RecName: Full=Protein-disulfide oxidoreductase DsbI [Lelliottia amnigena]AAD41462.1 disulfide isomerase [Lelliottia amnigena]